MNIVVCVKYVPDAQSDRTFNESDNTTDRVGVDGLLSELDEYAVEEALKLVEAGEGEVTVVTVGPDQAADAQRGAQVVDPRVPAEAGVQRRQAVLRLDGAQDLITNGFQVHRAVVFLVIARSLLPGGGTPSARRLARRLAL